MVLICMQRKSTRRMAPSSRIINRATSMVAPEIVTEDKLRDQGHDGQRGNCGFKKTKMGVVALFPGSLYTHMRVL
jgi:hypothetical protein